MGTTICCPSCHTEFELSAAMVAGLEADVRATVGKQFETELTRVRGKLAVAENREADLLRQQRELAEREQRLELDLQRRVNEEAALIRERERKLAEERTELQQEQQRLHEEEHRQKISGLEKTILELTRKVQQGSQQAQGEAQEIVLRDLLTAAFPTDGIEDVPKGVHGADFVHAGFAPS